MFRLEVTSTNSSQRGQRTGDPGMARAVVIQRVSDGSDQAW